MRIGVIAIQGNVSEHIKAFENALCEINVRADIIAIKHKGSVRSCDALVIPGGESTTLGRLLKKEGIADEIRKAAHSGIPIMGTCAGLILLAKHGDEQVEKTGQELLEIMDIYVNRNAFGRQRESFETMINFDGFEKPFNAVFIRAPGITKCGDDVHILSKLDNTVVAARQNKLLALAFHPELSGDHRIHHYFLKMIKK